MKKTLLSLLLLFTLTNLYADKIERDKNDPLQNLKIGDKFKVNINYKGNKVSFDFTGLGLDDSMLGKIILYHYQFGASDLDSKLKPTTLNGNDGEIISSSNNFYEIIINARREVATWRFNDLKEITTNIFKQTYEFDYDLEKSNKDNPMLKTIIAVKYYPDGFAKNNAYCFYYVFKMLANQNSEIELVGFEIKSPYGFESTGDINVFSEIDDGDYYKIHPPTY